MPPPDPYKTLELARDATPEQVRSAFRKLAKQYHPDLNPGNAAAEERFKAVNAANELLSDPDKHVHDAYGAFGEKKLYGKTVEGVIRSTFVVDEEGKISDARYNVKATGHVAKLRRDLALSED